MLHSRQQEKNRTQSTDKSFSLPSVPHSTRRFVNAKKLYRIAAGGEHQRRNCFIINEHHRTKHTHTTHILTAVAVFFSSPNFMLSMLATVSPPSPTTPTPTASCTPRPFTPPAPTPTNSPGPPIPSTIDNRLSSSPAPSSPSSTASSIGDPPPSLKSAWRQESFDEAWLPEGDSVGLSGSCSRTDPPYKIARKNIVRAKKKK